MWTNIFALLIAAIGPFLLGYNTSIIAGVLIDLRQEFSLTPFLEGIAVSIVLIGALVGAAVAGPIADVRGRRFAKFASAAFYAVGSTLVFFAPTLELFILGRAATGVGVGMACLIAPLYLSEIAPPKWRGAFVSVFQLSITLGVLAAYLASAALSNEHEWRALFGWAIFPALLLLGGSFLIPESPVFQQGALTKPLARWRDLTAPSVRGVLLIGIVLSVIQQATGINVAFFYAPDIFRAAGVASLSTALIATVGMGIVNLIASLLAMLLLDRLGRRTLLLMSMGGVALSFSLLSALFLVPAGVTTPFGEVHTMAQIALISCVAFFSLGLGPATWVLLAEIFPTEVRGKGMSIATACNWLFSSLVCLTFPLLLQQMGFGAVLGLYALLGVLAWVFIYWAIPETKGKILE